MSNSIHLHQVTMIEIQQPEKGTSNHGGDYETMELVVTCANGSTFSINAFSEGAKMNVVNELEIKQDE